MSKSLLNVHLDEDQVDDLNAALCAYRDHFLELIELNADAEGRQARENHSYWQAKVRQIQILIYEVSDSLYGAQSHAGSDP